jgi:protein DEK
MAEAGRENRGEADEVKQVVSEDLKKDADANEDDSGKPAEGGDVQMAEAGKIDVKDDGRAEDKDENKNVDKQDELQEKEKGGSADLEESKGKETGAFDKQGEEEAEEKDSADKKEEGTEDKMIVADEKAEKDDAENHGKGSEVAEEQVSEADKVVEENKEETPKNKKARSARDRSQGKDRKLDGTKSREAKSLLNTPSPYGTDRPQRERKTVERLVEAIEKEPNKSFVIEKVCLLLSFYITIFLFDIQ